MNKLALAPYNNITVLYLDFYGVLLTDRQAEILNSYFNEDYSLSEIAQGLDISRQAAHDAVRNGLRALAEYEDKLGLVKAYRHDITQTEAARAALAEMRAIIADIKGSADNSGVNVRALADKLDGITRSMEQQYITRNYN